MVLPDAVGRLPERGVSAVAPRGLGRGGGGAQGGLALGGGGGGGLGVAGGGPLRGESQKEGCGGGRGGEVAVSGRANRERLRSWS